MGHSKIFVDVRKAYRRKGFLYLLHSAGRLGVSWLEGKSIYFLNTHKCAQTFVFRGKAHKYLYSHHNSTWMNERTVEVPIVWNVINEPGEGRILEVGNVLSHYFPHEHDVVDKYERADGILNEDVRDFNAKDPYDLIVSISTLEHVGFDREDEIERGPDKILDALRNLEKCLRVGGRMVVTLPLGYNAAMDDLLRCGKLEFSEKFYLMRISRNNKWREATWDEVKDVKYGEPFPRANAILVGVICKK